jgi:hypothetical protein
MANQVEQEGDVGLDPADTELAQGAVGPLHRLLERPAPGGDLHQQRVEVRRNHRAAESIAAVEAHGEAAGGAIGGDAPVIGNEMAIGVFGRHAALHRHTATIDVILMRDPDRRLMQFVAGSNQQLAADQIDAGDHFGHRVFDLDARVDLDEEELAAVDVEQEFDGAGAAVLHRAAQCGGRGADAVAEDVGQVDAGRDFDDFLVAPLHRTVALPEVDEPPV